MGEISKMSTMGELREMDSLVVDSRELAELMDVEHRNLVRKIDTHLEHMADDGIDECQSFFIESSFINPTTHSTTRRYDVTKNGCELLAHKMTGKKGTMFSKAYIKRFRLMEEELSVREVDRYKVFGERTIANLKFDVDNRDKEIVYLKDVISIKDSALSIKDRRIAELEEQLARYNGVQLNVVKVGEKTIPPSIEPIKPIKTVEPILIETKKEKKKEKKNEGKKDRVVRLLSEYDFTIPPHDNPMRSDKHLPNNVFELSVTHMCNRGKWGLKPTDMNLLLEAFGLQIPIGNNERALVEKYEGLGYGRTVRTNKNDYQAFYGLRWSEAGFKYVGKIINMNKEVLDIFK